MFAFIANNEDKCNGLEGEVYNVADAEGEYESTSLGDMGERPCAEDNKVEEKSTDGEPKEVFNKGAGVFVQAFDYHVVLESCNDCEVEGYGWHDVLVNALGKPKSAKSCQNEKDGDGNEGYVVFLHGCVG